MKTTVFIHDLHKSKREYKQSRDYFVYAIWFYIENLTLFCLPRIKTLI